MQDARQQLHTAMDQVLAVRSGIQKLAARQEGGLSSEDAVLVQDVNTRVQQLEGSWSSVSQAATSLSQPTPQQSSSSATNPGSWWQGPLQQHLEQQLMKQYHSLPTPPPLSSPANSLAQGASALKTVVHQVQGLCPGAQIHLCSSTGAFGISSRDAAEVRMACPPVFCAGIVLARAGHPEPLRVTVDAYDQAAHLDPWSLSSHHIFRTVSSLVMCALAFFQQRATCHVLLGAKKGVAASVPQADAACKAGADALEDLLLWLLSYRNLFSQPCAVDGQLLVNEPTSQHALPPLFRPFRISKEALKAQVATPNSNVAFHLHNVPAHCWGEES